MTKKLISRILGSLFLYSLIAATCAMAQEKPISETPPGRPTVGLVLSGGGARGLAHIGVLKWFEDHHIPVDYLGGTSMGGLVGGMYAGGMSPDDMTSFIKTINWVSTFGTGIKYQDLSFRRKEDRRDYPVEMELGLKHGLSLPPGLSTGIEIDLLIDRITLPYSMTQTFGNLPIPFYCMATDILNAKEVIMNDGLLSSAMRATMSLPGIFPPVYRNGEWLVDGGVLNNIPTDVMRNNYKPDVVIAVDVGTPLGNEKSIQSFIGVASQTLGVLMVGSDRKNLKLADIIISPELKNITTADFSNIDATIALGYPAAEKVGEQLKKYALDDANWAKYTAERTARRVTTLPEPYAVKVTGVPEDAKAEIELQMAHFAGKPLVTGEIEQELIRLCGEGRYQSADYGFVLDEFQNPVLEIRITEKTYAPPTLDFAIVLTGSDVADFNFGFGTRLTLYDIGRYGNEWRNDFNVGFNSQFLTEFYRPFGRRGLMSRFGLFQHGFFFAPRAFYERGTRSFFSGGERVADYDVNNYGVGGDLGYETWTTELRVGYVLERLDANLSTGVSPIPSLVGKVDFPRVRFEYEGANSATIPTKGARFTGEIRYYLDSPEITDQFPWLFANGSWYKPVGPKGTFFAAGRFGTTFNKEAAPAQKFTLGGPFNLGAYDPNEFVGNNELLLSAGYYHSIYTLPPVIGRNIWVVGWYDLGGAFNEWDDANYKNQGSVGLIMDTKLGPFALIWALGQGGASKVYFSIGRFFD